MDQNKKCKCASYFSELVKKSGLIVPAFGALAVFALFFFARFIGVFDKLKTVSEIGFWLAIAFALVGALLVVVFIATKLKSKGVGAADTLLLMLDVLMVFLLAGIVAFDFLTLNTAFYAAALVICLVLTVLRVAKFEPECAECENVPVSSSVGVRKYLGAVIGKYNLWTLLLVAIGLYGAIILADIFDIPTAILRNSNYTIGVMIVFGLTALAVVISFINRFKSLKIGAIDGLLVLMLFTLVLFLITLITDFTIVKLVIWLVAIVVVLGFIAMLAANTYIKDDKTSDDFFATDGGKKFVKGPKVYFKQFVSKLNVIGVLAIAFMLLSLFTICVELDFFAKANAHGFMLFAVLAILILAILGLAYLGKRLKKTAIGVNDALLAILDVALVLLALPIFIGFDSGMLATVIVWGIALVFCIAFSITRLFKVREVAPEVEPAPEQQPEEENK